MEKLNWQHNFSVGVQIIDIQHQKLFSLVNELIDKTTDDQQKKIVGKVLTNLVDYTEYHFSTEERLLKTHPQFKEHQASHQGFIDKVSGFLMAFKIGSIDFKPAIIGFLVDWIKKHVLDMDKTYFKKLGYTESEENSLPDLQDDSLIFKKILIVEDNLDQRLLLKTILQQEGYIVLEAGNGIEALEIYQENTDLRLVITDINMPQMDGFKLVTELRKLQIRYTYIIIVTTLDDKESVIKGLSCGADDFLSKPIIPQELQLRIKGGQQLMKLEGQDELIFSLAKLSDYRSTETGLHLERVQQYTFEIGNYLAEHYPEKGVTKQLANEISKVSPLHDIGKVAISDSILSKAEHLTDEEFEIMKGHSRIGGDLISDIYLKVGSASLRIAFELTMYHHEKWDGTGYPAGLSGNGIPIAARIMALADVYDALTTYRAYKKAFSHEETKQIIIEDRGKHFDPVLVDIFLKLEDRFIKLKEKFTDG